MEKKFDVKKFLSNNAIIILIALLALFVGSTTQNFFTDTNGKNLLLNVAPRFIIACGVSGCLITKGTDLSAGRQVGLAACFSAMLLQSVDYSARMLPWLPDIPWPVALLIVIAIMACFGAINGCIIAFLKVPPFIATLGMQTIVYGLCSVITNNQPMGGYKQSYLTVASGTLGPIPFLAIFALIVGIFFWFLYNKTRQVHVRHRRQRERRSGCRRQRHRVPDPHLHPGLLHVCSRWLPRRRKGRRRFHQHRQRL